MKKNILFKVERRHITAWTQFTLTLWTEIEKKCLNLKKEKIYKNINLVKAGQLKTTTRKTPTTRTIKENIIFQKIAT